MKQHFAARIAAVAAMAVIATSGAALAQPAHGHYGGGGDVAMAIAALKGQLNLNTSQQQMWDNAVAASKAARETGRANFGRLQAALAAELAKAEPDLAAVAAVGDDVQAKNLALRHQTRDAWLAIYSTFSPDQKAIVRDALAKRIARMQRMMERHHQDGRTG
jgi:Spy/CpxP family protein refolding chaperone